MMSDPEQSTSATLSRRRILRFATFGLGTIALSPVLAACSQPAPTPTPVPKQEAKPAAPPPAPTATTAAPKPAAAPTATAAPKPTAAPAPTATAAPKPTAAPAASQPSSSVAGKLVWIHPPGEPWKTLNTQVIDSFKKKSPRIEVELLWAPDPGSGYDTKLKTMIAGGTPPDIIYGGDVWVLNQNPIILDLRSYVQRDAKEIDLDDFYKELLDAAQVGGKFFGLPRYFNLSLLYYNKKLFDAAGVKNPSLDWDWDKFVDAAKRMTKKDAAGKPVQWGSGQTGGWWGEWLIWVRQAGGDMFDDNNKPTKSALDTPEAIAGLKAFYDKAYTHELAPKPGSEIQGGFAGGAYAMDYGGHTSTWPVFNKSAGLDWDIEALPKGSKRRNGGELAIDAIIAEKDTKYPEAAWEFVKFATSKEAGRIWVGGGLVATRKSIAEEMWYKTAREKRNRPQNLEALSEGVKYAMPVPRHEKFLEIALKVVQPEVDLMMQNKQTPAKAGQTAAQKVNQFLATGRY
ncbi:MAG: sugar ABC transporter substrate-binding protein [Chloroflexi bacterium]|nr:sugar ABC transporter substrate-binding protein [Chloroflexota bacterium]